MLIYLDNCSFNRPFDNQKQIQIRLETEAKLYIQEQIIKEKLKLAWSYILDFENDANRAIIKKLTNFERIKVISPVDFIHYI